MTLKIIDIEGKEEINCTKCGFLIKLELRKLSSEQLQRVDFSGLLDRPGLTMHSNLRSIICPRCGKPHLCRDRFSSTIESEGPE